MPYSLDNWEDISIQNYDAWMQGLQSELDDYQDCGDEEGTYQIESEIRALASQYADQIRRESNHE